jgi:hypothetical protein
MLIWFDFCELKFCSKTKCHYFIGRCRRPKRSYIRLRDRNNATQNLELASKAEKTAMTTSHADATRPPSVTFVTFFGTLVSRSIFVCWFNPILLWKLCQPRGGWNNTFLPHSVKLRWLHAAGLSSCDPSFLRPPFFFSFSLLLAQL